MGNVYSEPSYAFQLTPSRRATGYHLWLILALENFNSRPHGGRPTAANQKFYYSYFNSRPHGGRHDVPHKYSKDLAFQLTPSRRATIYAVSMVRQV